MIGLIKRDGGRNKLKYEFIQGNDIVSVDRILNQTQINYLKKYGNTVINEYILAKLGETELVAEIKRLTGLDTCIKTYPSEYDGTSVIIQAYGEFPIKFTPQVVIYRTKTKDYYVLYVGNKEFARFKKCNVTLIEIKELLKMNGVVDYEIR